MQTGTRLNGNRLALAGTILYFLEWVAIAFLPDMGDLSLLGQSADDVLVAYRGNAGAISFAAGWFGFVLLGRILFTVALRKALRDSGWDSPLADFAVNAMTVSVALEIASFAAIGAAGWIAANQADPSAVLALDATGSIMFLIIFVPLAVSVAAASAAMWHSALLPRWLAGLGLLAGVLCLIGSIMQVAVAGEAGTQRTTGAGLTDAGVFGFWFWMIATSIILWRRAVPRGSEDAAI